MPAQTHPAIQGDSPTPLPPTHAYAPTHSLQQLTGEVLATAHLLQQQVRTLECLAHATEEREATLAQQRAKLQDLLRLVTQMETTEVRATTSLRDTLARVRAGRDGCAATSLSFTALRLAASPGGSPCPGTGLGEGSPSSPLGGTKRGDGSGAGGGGEGDADPVDNLGPGSVTPKGYAAEESKEAGGERRVGQPGDGEGTDCASKSDDEAGSGVGGDGHAEDTSQPLPQFASLRVRSEGGECGCAEGSSKEDHGAPQGDSEVQVDVPLPLSEADAVTSASRPMDQDRCCEYGRPGADSEHGAGRVNVSGLKEAQEAEVGEEGLASDPRPVSALGGATERQAETASMPSRQRNEPTEGHKAAVGSEGSWRARRRMPERNAKEQMKGSGTESRQGGARAKGGQGDIDGQASGQKKRGGQRTPSPKKAQVPGDRVQPSPPKKAAIVHPEGKRRGELAAGIEEPGTERVGEDVLLVAKVAVWEEWGERTVDLRT